MSNDAMFYIIVFGSIAVFEIVINWAYVAEFNEWKNQNGY